MSFRSNSLLKSIRFLHELPRSEAAARFVALDSSREISAEQTQLAIGMMFRGATMLKHALEWKSPSVGKGAKLDAVRGILWRHVMAYSGFEQLEMGLFGNQPNKSKERELFLASMNVERVLPGPILSQRAMNNLEERQENIESLCEFLNIHKNQRERFTNWLMGHVTQGGDDLMRTLMICAQLRHLVAHGALSADRSRKLGLIHSYSQAPDFLGEVALGYTSALVD